MNADELPTFRQALEAGDLKHEMILRLLKLTEEQAAALETEKHRADMANQWARIHWNGKKKADQALLDCAQKVVRDSAALARLWLRNEYPRQFPAGTKPTKDQFNQARMIANGIATYILKQVEAD